MVVHVRALKDITPEDYVLIEEAHLRLHSCMDNLRSTCCNLDNQRNCQSCTREKVATCQGRLVSFFHNMVEISTSHFDHEEAIMLGRPHVTKEYEDFRLHQQAHKDILRELNTIVSECASLNLRGETAEGYRQLYWRMSDLFERHDRLFDDPFYKSTKL
jgi:hemerythrin